MYSSPNKSVDKGLGFDFSGISDLVKSAATAGLNIYQNQMQIKQIKAMGQANMQAGYSVPVMTLPAAQMYGVQPTLGPSPFVAPPSRGMDTGTIVMLGAGLVGGLLILRNVLK
jgi:hypothetical protein